MKEISLPVVGAVIVALTVSPGAVRAAEKPSAALPRILDLGSVNCIPCKAMAPILDALRKDYAGKLQVDFIDVWRVEGAKERYAVMAIPTQIFYDARGRELTRHQGFIGREEVLATFRKAGIDVGPGKTH
jgi:thioredoxin 1